MHDDRVGEAYLVDLWQPLDFRTMQHPQGQGDHLQVFATGCGADVSGLRPHIVDDRFL